MYDKLCNVQSVYLLSAHSGAIQMWMQDLIWSITTLQHFINYSAGKHAL